LACVPPAVLLPLPLDQTLTGAEKRFRGSRYKAKTGEKAQFMRDK